MSLASRIRRLWEPDEVLIDGSFIPRENLRTVAENYVRSSHDAHRDAKRWHLRAEKAEAELRDLRSLLIELKEAES